ncbi:MAG: septal ring lytic transglycosylase RlpA family protein [Acidobacteriia bacterium]|nr:septal ring lytic transglycosylase RlpA family protein [Terriglobia bacterium]
MTARPFRRSYQPPQPGSFRAAQLLRPGGSLSALSFLCVLCALCVSLFSGCGSRRPVVDRRQPPPLAPAPAPPENSAPAAAPSAKRPARTPAAPAPAGHVVDRLAVTHTEEGNASWYGVPFDGRRASNGEIYDMNRMTAAHRTLPFDTMLRVTNLSNGRSATVRVTDRGPFVENRIIDLSLAAARELDMVGAGVVPVRLEVLSGPDPSLGFFTVQVGAFRDRSNAERLRDRLSAAYSPIFIQSYDSPDGLFYRVRVGRSKDEEAARQLGESLRAREGFTPFVIRLDETAAPGGTP